MLPYLTWQIGRSEGSSLLHWVNKNETDPVQSKFSVIMLRVSWTRCIWLYLWLHTVEFLTAALRTVSFTENKTTDPLRSNAKFHWMWIYSQLFLVHHHQFLLEEHKQCRQMWKNGSVFPKIFQFTRLFSQQGSCAGLRSKLSALAEANPKDEAVKSKCTSFFLDAFQNGSAKILSKCMSLKSINVYYTYIHWKHMQLPNYINMGTDNDWNLSLTRKSHYQNWTYCVLLLLGQRNQWGELLMRERDGEAKWKCH